MIFYAIYMDGKYLQGIEPNEHYSRTGIAPTMGARHTPAEYKTIWGESMKTFEPLTATNYIKCILRIPLEGSQACENKDHTKGGMKMDLDEIIKQLEDPRVDCITFQNSDLTAWLRELRDARELIRKQSAIIESQARYIETHIDRR